MLAAFRLLVRLAGRDLRTLASLAVNNLFFLVLFLLQGSNPRTMLWTAFPFVVLLGLPLMFASSGDPLQKVPAARLGLWPLTARERFILRLLGFGLNPVIWVAALLLLMKMGLAMALLFVAAIVLVQVAIAGVGYGIRRAPGLQVQRYVPQPPGRLGGIFRLGVRQMLIVLDFYVALVVSAGGLLYRSLGSHVDTAAYPVISIACCAGFEHLRATHVWVGWTRWRDAVPAAPATWMAVAGGKRRRLPGASVAALAALPSLAGTCVCVGGVSCRQVCLVDVFWDAAPLAICGRQSGNRDIAGSCRCRGRFRMRAIWMARLSCCVGDLCGVTGLGRLVMGERLGSCICFSKERTASETG